MTPLRVAFFGTPPFALATLQQIVGSLHQVVVVVTQPDRPRGRGQKIQPSPVKAFATDRSIPVLQPERLRAEPFLAEYDRHRADIGVVAAYGRILPRVLLERPPMRMINVHASLLPRWRGAAPVHRAVLAGDRETGVTIMRVVAELDAGPMLARERLSIAGDETSAALETRLATIGARLLVKTLDRLAAGPIDEEPQPLEGITYASRLERRESRVDWHRPADEIHNQVRGLQPWPMATVMLHGRRLRLVRSSVEPAPVGSEAVPGTVVHVAADSFDVAAAAGQVRVWQIQPEGKGLMSVRDFLLGHRVAPGDVLDQIPVE